MNKHGAFIYESRVAIKKVNVWCSLSGPRMSQKKTAYYFSVSVEDDVVEMNVEM